MDDFEKSLNSRLQNPNFKNEWDSQQRTNQIQVEQIKIETEDKTTLSESSMQKDVEL